MISSRGLELEFEKRIRKAITDDNGLELEKFIEEIRSRYQASKAGYILTYENAVRAFLEKLPPEPSILDLVRLLVYTEYWKAKDLMRGDPAEILSGLVKVLLSLAKEGKLTREEVERARTIAETVYTLTLSAQRR